MKIAKASVPMALLLGLTISLFPLSAGALDLSVGEKGITFEAGSAGSFTIEAPEISTIDGKKEKPVWETGEKGGVAKYANGAVLEMNIVSPNEFVVTFQQEPEGLKSLMFTMFIPLGLKDGGSFSVEGKDMQNFPDVANGQHVATGTIMDELKVVDASGDGFSVKMPTNWYTVQDNRTWNWNTFVFQALYDWTAYPDKKEITVQVNDLK